MSRLSLTSYMGSVSARAPRHATPRSNGLTRVPHTHSAIPPRSRRALAHPALCQPVDPVGRFMGPMAHAATQQRCILTCRRGSGVLRRRFRIVPRACRLRAAAGWSASTPT